MYYSVKSKIDYTTASSLWVYLILVFIILMSSAYMGLKGIGAATTILAGPVLLSFGIICFLKPRIALLTSLILSFFISGLTRYLPFQWGLGIDILLFIALLRILLVDMKSQDKNKFNKDFIIWSLVWMAYVFLQIINPEAQSIQAWFYAMRGNGFYQFMTFLLVVCVISRKEQVEKLLHLLITLSVLGSLWAIKQKYIGLDAVEYDWLWVDGHHDEHVLFGVLRAFSFYSDAGQFGASQAMFTLLCFILALGPWKTKYRLMLFLCAIITFIGFGISGSRGALAIPAFGGIAFLILSKNFKLLTFGLISMFLTLYLLKYTHVAHGVEQVRRMRTALDSDNPSLNARLKNQKTFGNHLRSRPFGGGIGSAGYWGERYSPNTVLAQTPTDSYYVKIWAETGIVGLCLHVLMLGYFIGKGALISWSLKTPRVRNVAVALYCSVVGILFASYGNQVYSQMPTGLIMSVFIPIIFLLPNMERKFIKEPKTHS